MKCLLNIQAGRFSTARLMLFTRKTSQFRTSTLFWKAFSSQRGRVLIAFVRLPRGWPLWLASSRHMQQSCVSGGRNWGHQVIPKSRKNRLLSRAQLWAWSAGKTWVKVSILIESTGPGNSEKAMAPHSSTLAWKIPWTEEPGGLQSVGCQDSDMTAQPHFHFSLSCIGEGNGNPLQCSCLENPRDGGAWWAAVYGVTQSRTRLKQFSSSSSSRPRKSSGFS